MLLRSEPAVRSWKVRECSRRGLVPLASRVRETWTASTRLLGLSQRLPQRLPQCRCFFTFRIPAVFFCLSPASCFRMHRLALRALRCGEGLITPVYSMNNHFWAQLKTLKNQVEVCLTLVRLFFGLLQLSLAANRSTPQQSNACQKVGGRTQHDPHHARPFQARPGR